MRKVYTLSIIISIIISSIYMCSDALCVASKHTGGSIDSRFLPVVTLLVNAAITFVSAKDKCQICHALQYVVVETVSHPVSVIGQ